ncbi:thiol oxidoreductase ['Osedax' symbiont bacterium Rs2_46_30_T18]|nr:thiol oxidoreductase ['Osedax' symbiont bacterium Rs2_46_30_T18]
MHHYLFSLIFFAALLGAVNTVAAVPEAATDFSRAQLYEHLPGGAGSSGKRGKNAFLQPAANLSFANKLDFKIGESIFAKFWVFSPSSTQASDGLGPLHNARSCMGCHIRGGRGHVPEGNWPIDNAISMLMRLSIEPQNEQQRALLASGEVPFIAEPTYGAQLQDFALQGMPAEGRISISYTEQPLTLADGTLVSLRMPSYSLADLNYGPLHPDTKFSVRIANPMLGLGLLEAISERDIMSLAEAQERSAEGISGRPNRVWEHSSQSIVLGRFGWKAGSPSLNQQNSAAFATDMGLSTPLFKDAYQGDCTVAQQQCLQAADGRSAHLGGLEVAQQMSQMLDLFVRNIAVPKRRNVADSQVLAGKKVFYDSGCAGCHQPSFITEQDAADEQAGQLIWPYTDLLLHDMGEGLADHRPEFLANGSEWRTAPLWGIGATAAVSSKTEFLHDGRARNLLEAILWHGGEAAQSRDKIINIDGSQRAALLAFLESL